MPSEIGLEMLWSFLLTLTRVSGVVAIVPVPGWKRAPYMTKAVISASIAIAMMPVWPKPPSISPSFGELVGWVLAETVLGVLMGLGVTTLVESVVIAAQLLGVQAGFSYASTVDPTTEADSGVLQVLCQLLAMLLFFSLGMDGLLLRALAASFQKVPLGAWHLSRGDWNHVAMVVGGMWSVAVRMALPVVAILMILDIVMALLSRLNAQLQLLTIAFPVKLLVTLVMMAALTGVYAGVFRDQASEIHIIWTH